MRLVFIDDSQQLEPPRRRLGSLLAIGGVLVPDSEVAGYAADLALIRKELGVPAAEELKWKPPRGTFLATAGGQVANSLRTRMLEAAADHHIRSVVVILDHSAAYTSRSRAEAGIEILKWLYERVSMCLADQDDIGVVIADKPGGGAAEEGHWLAETLQLTNDGTEYVQPDRVVLPIVTAPSHHVPHLQLADLVVAATTAAVAGRSSGVELQDYLRPLMHRHSLDAINGAGVVLFPERHNLYYWAFGEARWAKPSQMGGWSIPNPRFDYYADDGLNPRAENK